MHAIAFLTLSVALGGTPVAQQTYDDAPLRAKTSESAAPDSRTLRPDEVAALRLSSQEAQEAKDHIRRKNMTIGLVVLGAVVTAIAAVAAVAATTHFQFTSGNNGNGCGLGCINLGPT